SEFQKVAHPVGGFGRELGSSGIRQVGWNIKQCLASIVVMRGQHHLAHMLESQPAVHVFKTAAYCQRGRREYSGLELFKQSRLQYWRDIDRSGLQKNILPSPLRRKTFAWLCVSVPLWGKASPTSLNPKNSVEVF